ncbi:MAG TPA: flagellar export chaperone FliS [Dissulfurispiraceae bacterium]|nr:flagellar export chaperone FliS [Dissulfurispiraceae bacterium]
MTANAVYARNSYTNAKVMSTTDPLELVIMLYDGAIESLEKAAVAATSQQTALKLRFVDKALAIIDELLNCLNPEVGGEVAENLMNLYLYIMREITLANARNDADAMRRVSSLLRQLREGWVSIKGAA